MDTQKIDNYRLKTCEIVIVFFSIDNKNRKSCFFEKTFLLTDISIYITFEIAFLIMSNIKINFNN